MELNDVILNTISPQLSREAVRCPSPREKIQQIRKSLHLNAVEEKRLARDKYEAIVRKKGRRNWTSWAMELEGAFMDCEYLNVAGYNDAKAREDFIKCLCASSVPWVASCGVSFSVTHEMTKEEDRASLEDREASPTEIQCVICLETVSEPCELRPCRHLTFHYPCIDRWLRSDGRRRSCPICKATVSSVAFGSEQNPQCREYFTGDSDSESEGEGEGESEDARRLRRQTAQDELVGLDVRRHVYRRMLYSMHVGSNRYSGYQSGEGLFAP
ncbi:hypothetical protein CDD80_3389 [Ophiocordyceps camponoti-rufipedis]|uniref:RING-type domain-containing protein n=1 Tax=Ophiocordyceps camponoti-rufipedis TaxID=2004952 RepID=A0A2C5ZFZ3_9HYPO|nr:hypothetical protein CDD80_3389 [Ophiocordyceps camponoti-rufipedis]